MDARWNNPAGILELCWQPRRLSVARSLLLEQPCLFQVHVQRIIRIDPLHRLLINSDSPEIPGYQPVRKRANFPSVTVIMNTTVECQTPSNVKCPVICPVHV